MSVCLSVWLSLCIHMCACRSQRQLVEIGSLSHVGLGDWIRVIRLGSRLLVLLRYHRGPHSTTSATCYQRLSFFLLSSPQFNLWLILSHRSDIVLSQYWKNEDMSKTPPKKCTVTAGAFYDDSNIHSSREWLCTLGCLLLFFLDRLSYTSLPKSHRPDLGYLFITEFHFSIHFLWTTVFKTCDPTCLSSYVKPVMKQTSRTEKIWDWPPNPYSVFASYILGAPSPCSAMSTPLPQPGLSALLPQA